MQRSGGVTVIAIFSLLGSLLLLAAAILTFVAALFFPHPTNAAPITRFAPLLASIVITLPSIWGICTAIGLLRLKKWAWISILIFSSLLLFMGLFTPLMFLVMPPPPHASLPEFATVKLVISTVYLLLALIGAWWLTFFTRPGVKSQFGPATPSLEKSGRPLSISIIGWLMISSVLFFPINLLLHLPAAFFGMLLTGWAAAAVYLVFGVIQLYLEIGLLKLKPQSRVLTIYLFAFGGINGICVYLLPGYQARMTAILNSLPSFMRSGPVPPPIVSPWPFIALVVAGMLIQIYFLVTRKAAFQHPTTDPQSAPL